MISDINHSLIFNILGLHLMAVMSPGPDFVLITKNALSYSRSTAIYTALGIAMGLSIHLIYSLAGLGLILQHNQKLFRTIQIIGALYLAYIALSSIIGMIKKRKNLKLNGKAVEISISPLSAIKMGFFTNLFNPKVGLFFVSIFTQFFQETESTATMMVVALGIIIVTFVYFSMVSIAITIPKLKEAYLRVEFFIDAFFAVVLLSLSISILSSN